MKVARSVIFIFMMFLFQTVVLSHLRPLGGSLDLMVCIVITWGLMRGVVEGLFAGLFAGLLMDVFTVNVLFFMPLYSVMGIISGLLRESVFRDEDAVFYFSVLFGGLLSYAIGSFVMVHVLQLQVSAFWPASLMTAFASVLFVPLVKRSLEKLNKNE